METIEALERNPGQGLHATSPALLRELASRLYGQEELRAILHVKRLRAQGVRISEAMVMVARGR
jgi:hypothetical protein